MLMHRVVIVNSTPIIALLDIGQIDILKALYDEIIIPEAVRDEVTAKDEHALDNYTWIKVHAIKNIAAKDTFISSLHDGEVEVMILAKEINSDLVILDDSLARRHAKHQGLTITGTVGVILRAKHNGIIDSVKPLLDGLVNSDFYISESVIDEVLKLAGE